MRGDRRDQGLLRNLVALFQRIWHSSSCCFIWDSAVAAAAAEVIVARRIVFRSSGCYCHLNRHWRHNNNSNSNCKILLLSFWVALVGREATHNCWRRVVCAANYLAFYNRQPATTCSAKNTSLELPPLTTCSRTWTSWLTRARNLFNYLKPEPTIVRRTKEWRVLSSLSLFPDWDWNLASASSKSNYTPTWVCLCLCVRIPNNRWKSE